LRPRCPARADRRATPFAFDPRARLGAPRAFPPWAAASRRLSSSISDPIQVSFPQYTTVEDQAADQPIVRQNCWSEVPSEELHPIDSLEVYLLDGPGEAELMSRDEALAIARSRGLHLIPEWPEHQTTGSAFCRIGVVSLPVRWEQVSEAEQAGEPDPLLWSEAPCGGDLLAGNGGTYPGRMSAWCLARQVSYGVSLAEMGQMSQQARKLG